MNLSTTPFKSLADLFKQFPNEDACVRYLELNRWEGNVISPFDATSKVYKCKNNRYRCSKTKKYFNVRTGTIFDNTKVPLQQWFLAIYLFSSHKKGISSHQLARDLDITQKTSWFILHRIRYAMTNGLFTSYMEGVVEVDETFVGGKNKNRHKDKKIEKSQGRSFKDKTPVLGLLNREGNLKCVVVPDTKAESIQPIIHENVKPGSIVMSDEWTGYNGLADHYTHMVVDHGRGQYVNDEGGTTNGIENAWSNFKKTLIGTYHNNVSRKHLQRYADEFTFRFNTRRSSTFERFNVFLTGTNGKRLKYNDLIL